jgi:hypothetical protein
MTFFESSSRSIFLFAHDLFGKPVPTFPDHALAAKNGADGVPAGARTHHGIGAEHDASRGRAACRDQGRPSRRRFS